MAPLSPYDLRTAAGRGPERFPAGHRWDSSPKIRFAQDSPLEERRFEPSVPSRGGVTSSHGSEGPEVDYDGLLGPVLLGGGPRVRIAFPPAASPFSPVP